MITELRRAIFKVGGSVAGIYNKFYWDEAPKTVTLPYAIATKITGVTDRDTSSEFKDEYIQINIYDRTLTGAETIEADLKTKFYKSEALLNSEMTSTTVIGIALQNDRQAKLENVFQISMQYLIKLN